MRKSFAIVSSVITIISFQTVLGQAQEEQSIFHYLIMDAIRIECTFKSIVVGGAKKLDDKNTTGLAELMKTRPLYKSEKISGTMVGFYNPPSFGSTDLSPFHFHFISAGCIFR